MRTALALTVLVSLLTARTAAAQAAPIKDPIFAPGQQWTITWPDKSTVTLTVPKRNAFQTKFGVYEVESEKVRGKLLTGTQTRFLYSPELEDPEYISINYFTITFDVTRRSAGSSQTRNICIVRKPGKVPLKQSLVGIHTQRDMIQTLLDDPEGTGVDYIQTGKTGAYANCTLKRVK